MESEQLATNPLNWLDPIKAPAPPSHLRTPSPHPHSQALCRLSLRDAQLPLQRTAACQAAAGGALRRGNPWLHAAAAGAAQRGQAGPQYGCRILLLTNARQRGAAACAWQHGGGGRHAEKTSGSGAVHLEMHTNNSQTF